MTYEDYYYLFYGTGIACLLMLIVSAVLFFVLHIPSVINDLSGRTAKRAIENIRNQNRASGDKNFKPSIINRQRGKLTEKISVSGKLQKHAVFEDTFPSMTERICQQSGSEQCSGETALLDQNMTTVLEQDSTTLLSADPMETSVLSQPMEAPGQVLEASEQRFSVDYEVTYIHTSEVIA